MALVEPILHLSLPVLDLEASKRFYVEVLGCEIGREQADFVDVWFYGLQLTLQEHPDQVLPADLRGVRHFGVTVGADELVLLLARAEDHDVEWLSRVRTDHAGTEREGIWFGRIEPLPGRVRLAWRLDVDEWNGQRRVQMVVEAQAG